MQKLSFNHHMLLLTFDVEDWFQVENLKSVVKKDQWSSFELRVEKNVHRILDLLDTIPLKGQGDSSENVALYPKATFFVLGWIAQKKPQLVREICNRGHEIASHGFNHHLLTQLDQDAVRSDLIRSKNLLEDIIGEKVVGYRAPSFSISDENLKIVEETGYLYDSSYNSFSLNDNYGRIDAQDFDQMGIALKVSNTFFEIPISNMVMWSRIIPWGGGAYFRLIPLPLFLFGVHSCLKKNQAYMFYLHPWEIDDTQPRVKKISLSKKIKHYTNLKKTYHRLETLIQKNSLAHFLTCTSYLKRLGLNK